MKLETLFEMLDSLLGDKAVFQGLAFTCERGAIVIDFMEDVEFEGELVNGYLLNFLPYDDNLETYQGFALDEAGLKYLLEEDVFK